MRILKVFGVFLIASVAIGTSYAGGLLPHAIYGQLLLSDGVTRADTSNLLFDAYVIDRPDEVITETTPGCRIESKGTYVVECSSFETPWAPGDIVQIEVFDFDFNLLSIVQVELNDTGTNLEEIILYSDKLIGIPTLAEKQVAPAQLQ